MPLRFTLRQLEYLVAVADCGSVSLAAARVNVSSPSISAAIGQLEASFGMRAMVANGFGYSIANIRLGSDRAPDGRKLIFVPLQGDVRPMQIGLLLPKSGDRRRAVAAFVAHCQTAVTEAALPGLYGDGP